MPDSPTAKHELDALQVTPIKLSPAPDGGVGDEEATDHELPSQTSTRVPVPELVEPTAMQKLPELPVGHEIPSKLSLLLGSGALTCVHEVPFHSAASTEEVTGLAE